MVLLRLIELVVRLVWMIVVALVWGLLAIGGLFVLLTVSLGARAMMWYGTRHDSTEGRSDLDHGSSPPYGPPVQERGDVAAGLAGRESGSRHG